MDFKIKPIYEISENNLMDAIEHVYGVHWKVSLSIVKEYFCRTDPSCGWEIHKGFLKNDIGSISEIKKNCDPNLVEKMIRLFAEANPNGYYEVYTGVELLTDDIVSSSMYFEKDANIPCPVCQSKLIVGDILDIVDGKLLRDSDVCGECIYESEPSLVDISHYTD